MKRPAPYRHEVDAALAAGRHPDVIVFTGPLAHERAEQRRIHYGPASSLVLPEGHHPDEFGWPPLTHVAVACDQFSPRLAAEMKTAIKTACTRTASDL